MYIYIYIGIEKVVEKIESIPKVKWDFEGIHYFDNGPLTVQYLLVLDALNFCFWPGMGPNHLTKGDSLLFLLYIYYFQSHLLKNGKKKKNQKYML